MSTPSDDAQRELERRALRNVRGLVDRIEQSDEADARTQKKLLVAIIGGAAIVAVVLVAAMLWLSRERTTVTLPSAKPGASTPAAAPSAK